MYEYIKTLALPITWVMISLACGLVLTFKTVRASRRQALGWYFILIGSAVLLLLSLRPVNNFLAYKLESKFAPVSNSDLGNVDVIIILGGGIKPQGSFQKTPEAGGVTYSRVFNGVEAFKRSKARKLVVSGGIPGGGYISEAEVMRDLAAKLGVNQSKLILEQKSHTTKDEAFQIRKMGIIDKNTRIGLVTSALHMGRSVWVFNKVFPENKIVPVPVGYIYEPRQFSFRDLMPNAQTFSDSAEVIHEWLGLWFYRSARYDL
jgi:uncharacterized SAM-binding protein YcdF (DUF218 family)